MCFLCFSRVFPVFLLRFFPCLPAFFLRCSCVFSYVFFHRFSCASLCFSRVLFCMLLCVSCVSPPSFSRAYPLFSCVSPSFFLAVVPCVSLCFSYVFLVFGSPGNSSGSSLGCLGRSPWFQRRFPGSPSHPKHRFQLNLEGSGASKVSQNAAKVRIVTDLGAQMAPKGVLNGS